MGRWKPAEAGSAIARHALSSGGEVLMRALVASTQVSSTHVRVTTTSRRGFGLGGIRSETGLEHALWYAMIMVKAYRFGLLRPSCDQR